MNTQKIIKRAAAFIAALTLTAGAAMPTGSITSSAPLIVFADEAYTEVKEGVLTFWKYSDHAEINRCDMSATSVEIPSSVGGVPVTAIGMYAFQVCGIKSITIPDSITEIGNYAFSMCSELTSVTISDSVQKIGIRAFSQCPKLENVELPNHIIDIQAKVFSETPWHDALSKKNPLVIVNGMLIDAANCEGDVVVPSDVKFISAGTFQRNPKLTSVVVPASVTKINDNVFALCDNLKSVELKGAESIDMMAFYDCPKLTELKLSGKLKTISDGAFMDTKTSATITFYGSKETWEKVQKPSNEAFLNNAKYIFDENHTDIDEEIVGDVDKNGTFNVADLVLFQKWLLGVPGAELKNWEAADLDKNGILDSLDLVLMRKEILK